MTETENKAELSPLDIAEQNLKTALNAWSEEINVSEMPKSLQRKHRVVRDKTAALMYDVHEYLTTQRPAGRPAGGITKTEIRQGLTNASPDQLKRIAAILEGEEQNEKPEISPVSPNMVTNLESE